MIDNDETVGAIAAKVAPPVTVSLATVYGLQVSDLVIWATLIYTLLMIGLKLYQIYKEVKK
jgi:Phage holin T7 family, holin superfamily II